MMNQQKIRVFEALPKPHLAYAGIIKSLLPRQTRTSVEQMPKRIYRIDNLTLDGQELKNYRRICHFFDDGRVPPTYFAMLSQQLQLAMMTTEPFGFAILGLIHIDNTIKQYRYISDGERFGLAVRFDNLRDHPKGQCFDFITQVWVKDELVWEGSSTYLSRQAGTRARNLPKAQADTPVFNQKLGEIYASQSIGRRYASVSGDYNPIHLHPLSARAFGFPKAIAHGMWTKARALALLQSSQKLAASFMVQCQFLSPIFLPSKIELWINNKHPEHGAGDVDCHDFFVLTKPKTDPKIHLLGHWSAL